MSHRIRLIEVLKNEIQPKLIPPVSATEGGMKGHIYLDGDMYNFIFCFSVTVIDWVHTFGVIYWHIGIIIKFSII